MALFDRKSRRITELEAQVKALRDSVVLDPSVSLLSQISRGGIMNAMSGMGGLTDKSEGFFYLPTRYLGKTQLETIYAESWACRNFIDIPIDDMLVRWRAFDDIDSDESIAITLVERTLKVRTRLAKAMKAGRLHGTGLLLMITKEAALNTPLNVERIRPGDLIDLIPIDRYDCGTPTIDYDLSSPTYGEPVMYQVNLRRGGRLEIHASRVLRFDAIEPLSINSWQAGYEMEWGVSELPAVISAITQEDAMAKGINHLVQECSIPVVGIQDFTECLMGSADADISLEDRAIKTSQAKSLFRTVFMDKEDTFNRLEVNFANIPDLMDRYARRLAAAAKIPMTRFWGTSPVGMNATGEGDMKNYAIQVAAMQEAQLREPLNMLDEVLMRHIGIKELPSYKFPPLTDISETDQVAIAEKKMNVATLGVSGGIMDEGEAREILSGDPIIGDLDENWTAIPEDEPLPGVTPPEANAAGESPDA